MSLLWTALVMGLMGGFHCIGMCGPIAMALPGSHFDRMQYIQGRIFYNFGRVTTYVILGIIFGIFGLTLNLAGLHQSASIISGLLILLLQFSPGNVSGKISKILRLPILVNGIKKSFSNFLHKKGFTALFSIGLLNGILPCGFVYLALAGSLTTGSVAGAAEYMLLFGLGTFPIMLTLSLTGNVILSKYKFKIQRAVPYVTFFIAFLFILRGLSLGIPYLSPKMANDPVGGTEISICH